MTAPPVSPLAPTRSRVKRKLRSDHSKWTEEEDELLKTLVSRQPNVKWSDIAHYFPTKTAHQISDRWVKALDPRLVKGSWMGEEDQMIVKWVEEHGAKDWIALAQLLPGRISKQCRERWHNHLCPSVVKAEWTEQEDNILIEYQRKWGNKWSKIAALLPGRTDHSVKNRWNSSLKRRLERLENGESGVSRRGRKPKRPSEAPPVTSEIPKPPNDMVLAAGEVAVSPIFLQSPLMSPGSFNFLWSGASPWKGDEKGGGSWDPSAVAKLEEPIPFCLDL